MLVIDSIIYSIQKAGGISVYFSEIVERLNHYNYPFKEIYYQNSNKVRQEYQQEMQSPVVKLFLPLVLARYLDVFLPSATKVFHSSYYRLPFSFQRKKVKIVTTVHDFTYERHIGGFSTKLHHWQKKRAVLASDVIICISKNTKKDLIHFIPEASNRDIRVIYNGVSDAFFPLDNYSVKKDKSSILFIGARGGYKNFESLVVAMGQLVDKTLVIVGGGSIAREEQVILDRYCRGRYQHVDFVSNEQLNLLYNEAFSLVYPSLYEGFGIPAVEAMKAGCPVIAANSSSLPEVCADAAILLDEVDDKSIVNAINSLRNENLRSQLINAGFKNSSRFSWDKMFQELREIYLG